MSSGNGYASSSIANIALPPQSSQATAAATVQAPGPSATTIQPSYHDYYSSPEYQQYYQAQQQYNNALYQQQYAAYYQQQQQAAQSVATDPTAAAAAYQAALYGQAQAGYLTGAYPMTNPTAAASGTNVDNSPEDDDDDDDDPTIAKDQRTKANTLPYHCNAKMGLNPLLHTNIIQSPYFKNSLFQLKTYLEVIDEIYYNVKHLEPWEKGSRKLSGQTGMCGSVRGVGAGGIISTPFCILFKLYTLRLNRKQVNGLLRHKDSPFIRGLGFIYVRYTQPPKDLWKWFEPYLSDDEQVDPKAGGGLPMTIGEMVRMLLTKAEWFGTLFPRIPIPVQKEIDENLLAYDEDNPEVNSGRDGGEHGNRNIVEERGDKSNGSYYGNKNQRSESKYSSSSSSNKYGGSGHGSRSRSRSRSPSRYHDSKRSKKYDDDRRSDRSNGRSNRY